VNGEAIYETRPWHVFGEGPTNAGSGAFDERERAWTPEDYRFTRKGDTVFALQMAWPPDRRAVITSMKLESGVRVGDVRLVGHDAIVAWHQTGVGLEIDLPAVAPSDAVHVLAVQLVER
jgi:alpha-L-fucosidase